jgi:signal transduction histidine kinase
MPSLAATRSLNRPGAPPFLQRIAVRLAILQAVILVGILACVAYFGHVAQETVARNVIESRVKGEIASLEEEVVSKGSDHLQHTIEKRTRLWRGFEYRLSGTDGGYLAGVLPQPEVTNGWSVLSERDDGGARRIVTYSERLPDGRLLSVGQDLSAEERQTAILTNILLWSGALSIAGGFGISCLFAANGWRRVSALARVAREAATGNFDIRVPTPARGFNDDIDELGTTFNTMLTEIGNLMNQVQQVSTAVAHDLRTPLTRLRQKTERLAAATSGNPELSKSVQQIDRDLEELSRTFDAILRLAEIENSREFHHQPIDLGAVVARVTEAFRPEIEENGRTFHTHIEAPHIVGDQQLIFQAVANLIDNALHHTPAGTTIEVGVEQRSSGAAIFVADRGPGIPEGQRAIALDRFRKLNTSRSGRGCGLGLSIVAAIARRHAAVLSLLDAKPGLRVELQFPFAQSV